MKREGDKRGGELGEKGEGEWRKKKETHAVPVSVNSRPPRVIRSRPFRVRVNVVTVVKSQVDDAPLDRRLLVGGPSVVEPVVRDREGRRELGEVEPVEGVPVVASRAEGLLSVVAGGGLEREGPERWGVESEWRGGRTEREGSKGRSSVSRLCKRERKRGGRKRT